MWYLLNSSKAHAPRGRPAGLINWPSVKRWSLFFQSFFYTRGGSFVVILFKAYFTLLFGSTDRNECEAAMKVEVDGHLD